MRTSQDGGPFRECTIQLCTLRLAEASAKYLCSLMRRAETLATPETECLLYATYWFRPILSELIGAATESAAVNRDRAPSGPVKVVVTNQPHSRPNAGIDLASGVSALLAWFPASWASKVAPCFIGDAGGATQLPQEVAIQCPTREAANTQRDDGDQVLQAVKFTDKKVPGLHLDLDEDLQAAGCFTEAIRGYQMVFLFGLLPLLCVWFAVFRFDETQIWLGDLRVVLLVCVVFWFVVICQQFRTFWVFVQMTF